MTFTPLPVKRCAGGCGRIFDSIAGWKYPNQGNKLLLQEGHCCEFDDRENCPECRHQILRGTTPTVSQGWW